MNSFLECLRHICFARSALKLFNCKKHTENMTPKASQKLYEIKVAAEIGVTATQPDVPASSGRELLNIFKQDVRPIHERINLGWQRNWSTDESHIDLESGFKTDEVVCKCSWFQKCPKCDGYGRSENDRSERIVEELMDKNHKIIAFEFISAERVNRLKENGCALNVVETVKKLKDEGCELLCIPVEFVNEMKDNFYALKFIPVEAVEVSSDDDRALKFITDEMVQKLKEDGYALFIPVEMVQKLKENGYALFIPVEMVQKLKEDGYALFIPVEMVQKLKEDGYALIIPVEMAKKLKDGDYVEMGSGGITEEVVKWSQLERIAKYFGYANDYIEKTVKPEMGFLFSGATMQNIYQLVTSGMVKTGKGKTLMKLNEAAFMMLLYGLVMPRRAAGHIAMAVGVALASAAYLVTMSFAF